MPSSNTAQFLETNALVLHHMDGAAMLFEDRGRTCTFLDGDLLTVHAATALLGVSPSKAKNAGNFCGCLPALGPMFAPQQQPHSLRRCLSSGNLVDRHALMQALMRASLQNRR